MRYNKLIGAFCFGMPLAFFGQDSLTVPKDQQVYDFDPVYTSGDLNAKPFTNSSRKFRDWSISVGGGPAFMQSADLTSFYDGKVDWGWNVYASLDKQITHAFGLSLMYSRGETNQRNMAREEWGVAEARTRFNQLALIGDLNVSNLLRSANKKDKEFKWAFHAYGGGGIQGYKTSLNDNGRFKQYALEIDQPFDQASVYWTFGFGLKYKLSKLIDLELRTMYILSGDDAFDGSGTQGGYVYENDANPYMKLHNTRADNAFTVNLGASVKLGKQDEHLVWFDPMQDIYSRISVIEARENDFVVCKSGDKDNDGVCDDWDRELNTPAGARVDGAGVALDLDLDGVIDLYDKCPTIPANTPDGCPEVVQSTIVENEKTIKEQVETLLSGIEFSLNSATLRKKSYENLDAAARLLKQEDSSTRYDVIGTADASGPKAFNLSLSKRRAMAVVNYLVRKGINKSMFVTEGRGSSDLKYPECDPASKCPSWKNQANRRVYLQQK